MLMLIMYIFVFLGMGLVIYAVIEVFKPGKEQIPQKKKFTDQPLPTEDPGKDQKIQRLQGQIVKLETQLEEARVATAEGRSGSAAAKEKEAGLSVELKRREEWVAKAEAELAKIKAENADLNNKFTAKEKELEEEFTKNVNFTREMREVKAALEAKEMACRLKEDQVQTQKHQIESQLKSINEHLAAIAEFKRKEKISEWVPKLEFNQLNAEYTKLEKELEASQERLKSFAVEIAHLRQLPDKNNPPSDAIKPPAAPEDAKPQEIIPVEIKLEQAPLEKAKPEEENIEKPPTPQEAEPTQASSALEKMRLLEESLEKQDDEKEGQQ